eukprot:7861682-Prorocentrum_lima.AAC.1
MAGVLAHARAERTALARAIVRGAQDALDLACRSGRCPWHPGSPGRGQKRPSGRRPLTASAHFAAWHQNTSGGSRGLWHEPPVGFEPTTSRLLSGCSTS